MTVRPRTATGLAPASSRWSKNRPALRGQSRTDRYEGGTPCAAVAQFWLPLTTWTACRLAHATSLTAGHSLAIAVASATVSDAAEPELECTPLAVVAPGMIIIRLFPRLWISCCTAAFAPRPMLTIVTTAAKIGKHTSELQS